MRETATGIHNHSKEKFLFIAWFFLVKALMNGMISPGITIDPSVYNNLPTDGNVIENKIDHIQTAIRTLLIR